LGDRSAEAGRILTNRSIARSLSFMWGGSVTTCPSVGVPPVEEASAGALRVARRLTGSACIQNAPLPPRHADGVSRGGRQDRPIRRMPVRAWGTLPPSSTVSTARLARCLIDTPETPKIA
jgi:hypothetical protein